MEECFCKKVYRKLDPDEIILPGDLVAITNTLQKVMKASASHPNTNVVGVCYAINENNEVVVQSNNIINVNVTGNICIGDKLTISFIPGKARAICYASLEERQYNIKSIGKVIGVYDVYDKARVLLDIE